MLRLWYRLRWHFYPTAMQREVQRISKREDEAFRNGPPPLPPARTRYVLYRTQPGYFDLHDDGCNIGGIERIDGDEEHDTFWQANAWDAHFNYFRSLKAAKEWLGNPPVRSYR